MVRKTGDSVVRKSMLDDAVETILKGMDNLFLRFKGELTNQLEPLKADITFIKRDLRDTKVELSDTPTSKEFNELKTKVHKYNPLG